VKIRTGKTVKRRGKRRHRPVMERVNEEEQETEAEQDSGIVKQKRKRTQRKWRAIIIKIKM
jgi:hypothetical protein